MNYTWNWGVLSQSTGIGDETYLDWIVSGLGWLFTIGSIAWIIAIVFGYGFGRDADIAQCLGAPHRHFVCHHFSQYPLIGAVVCLVLRGAYLVASSIQQWWVNDLGSNTTALISASVGLGLFTAARICEQVRTGIESLPKGQKNAGYALGFTTPQLYKTVVLPQSFRVILPPLSSELTNCFKNASIASLVGVSELISQVKTISEYTQSTIEVYAYATLIYIVLNLSLIGIMGLLERKLRVPGLIAGGK
jgi:glutamate/aspartate transport system permease protein